MSDAPSSTEGQLGEEGSSRTQTGKKVYGHWKQGQVTQGDYRDAISHCREKIHVDKGHLELGIAVKDNKKATF